jgi:hypothetical protein
VLQGVVGLLDNEAWPVDIVSGILTVAAATNLCLGGWVLAPGLWGDEDVLRGARPHTVREFMALFNQHMRWELNDLAGRLDNQPVVGELYEGIGLATPSSLSKLSPDALGMLQAIEVLPEEEREVYDLVRIQGMA